MADDAPSYRPSHGAEPSMAARAILVLGMHRSGTSALTRLLSLCGASLPEHLMAASAEDNLTGFWESPEIAALNDEILAAAGRSWHDIRAIPEAWFASEAAAAFSTRLSGLLVQEFGAAPLLVVKDPRLCRLMPLWRPVLAGLGIQPHVIIPVRNPLEVAASLEKRENFGEGKSLLLWLSHLLEAERESRDLPRCFVTYDQVLADGPRTVARIGAALGIAWPREMAQAAPEIEDFLSAGLRHHARDAEAVRSNPDLPGQVKDAYRWFIEASEMREPPGEALDRIRAEFERSELIFGGAIGAFEAQAQRRAEELRHWIGAAVERYALIEQLQGDIAALQRRNAELAREAAGDSAMRRVLAPMRAVLRRWRKQE
jgi:hypothetical protein